jgi:ABC-type multidrug transport system ATPase subunit
MDDMQRAGRLSATAVLADGLYKRFGKTQALCGVDLRVEQGTVCALLGPNGAGKTTIVRILATLLRPDAGRAHVAGYDVVRDGEKVRHRCLLNNLGSGSGRERGGGLVGALTDQVGQRGEATGA